MGHDLRTLTGGTEAVDTDHTSRAADVTPPALSRGGLHGEPTRHGARQHRLAVCLVLLVEYLGRGHGDQTHAPPGLVEGLHRLRGDADFGAGRNHQHLRCARTIDEYVAAAADGLELSGAARLLRYRLA